MLEDLKIGPRYGGFVFLAAAQTIPRLRPHRHVELELNLVERGTITYVVDGRRLRFPTGTLLWLYPDQEHQLVDRTEDARYYVAVFKPSLIRQAGSGAKYAALRKTSPETPDTVVHTELQPQAFDLTRRLIAEITADGLDPDLLSREAGFGVSSDFHYEHHDPDWLNAGLRLLLLHAWRLQRGSVGAAKPVHLHPAVSRALKLLSDDVDQHDLEDLARQCGVSEAYLSRTFARQMGVPISRYRNAVRLRRFWDVYRGPNQPSMTDAAYAAGFGSYAQFFKVFAAAYGRGPRESMREPR